MTVEIRAARPEEADSLSALALRSKAVWGYDEAFIAACRPLLTVRVDEILANRVFAAEDSGQTLGFYSLMPFDTGVEIDMLFIEPESRGRRIGQLLFRHACDTACSWGAHRLTVESDPFAEPFYRKMGMRLYGQRESTIQSGRMLPLLELELS